MALPLRYNVLSAFSRPAATISSILLIAVIIAAFAYLQAVTDSAFSTMTGTGDANTLIVLGQSAETETVSGLGKDQVNKLELAPGIVQDGDGPLISPEMVAISSAYIDEDDDVAVNTAVRGVDFEKANLIRGNRVEIIKGKGFEAGRYEVIVGKSAHRTYVNFDVGDEIQLGTRGMRMFKIVGVFDSGGTAADSEIWGYVETLRDVYGRNGYSSARCLVNNESEARQAIEYIEGPSVQLTAMTEREYFSELNTNQTATRVLSVVMIFIMGIAAIFAIANTMFAAVAGRTSEIGMLRAIGFSNANILTAFLLEGMLLSFLGGILGSLISMACNGMQQNMLPSTFTMVSYALVITPKIIGTSIIVAVVIGLFGSIVPAWRASRLSVVSALRDP